jgi:hypothetical protein
MNLHTMKKNLIFLHTYFLPYNLKYKNSNGFSFSFATGYGSNPCMIYLPNAIIKIQKKLNG